MTEAIEPLRRDKIVGSSLQAEVQLPEADFSPDLAELFITAQVTKGDRLTVTKTEFRKMRPLLAAFARSDPRRRSVRPVRGGGP